MWIVTIPSFYDDPNSIINRMTYIMIFIPIFANIQSKNSEIYIEILLV